MYYLVLLGIAILVGCVLAIVATPKTINKRAYLMSSDDKDISCDEAFETLELLNSWGEHNKKENITVFL